MIKIFYKEVTMVIEVSHLNEIECLRCLPNELQEKLYSILQVLDEEYGSERMKYEDAGGYVVIIEKKEDMQKIKNQTYIDFDEIIPEYVDKIICANGEIYTNSLILCNNDFGISFIMPLSITPQNLKDYIIA
jgi:hypothetical protein